jgi:hypothetical protein
MAIITVKHKGSFKNTEKFFDRALRRDYKKILHKYGQAGVELLKEATPVDSGVTAESWSYDIEEGKGYTSVVWKNKNSNEGMNIAILVIYGHGLENGGYVEGENFVTPAIRPLLGKMADNVWREVTK